MTVDLLVNAAPAVPTVQKVQYGRYGVDNTALDATVWSGYCSCIELIELSVMCNSL